LFVKDHGLLYQYLQLTDMDGMNAKWFYVLLYLNHT